MNGAEDESLYVNGKELEETEFREDDNHENETLLQEDDFQRRNFETYKYVD